MLPSVDRAVALQCLAKRLSLVHSGFGVDGDVVVGPGFTMVWVDNTCDMAAVSPRVVHLDITFALNFQQEETFIRTCATSGADPREEAVRQAVDIWMGTTAPAIMTLLNGGSAVLGATHLPDDELAGMHGLHPIVGPHVLLGSEGHSPDLDRIREFVGQEPPLARIAHVLPPYRGTTLNGIMLVCTALDGKLNCDVRVNGDRHQQGSVALADLSWPPGPRSWIYRQFTLLLKPGPK